MSIQNIISNEVSKIDLFENFLDSDQFQRRKLLSNYILNDSESRIGRTVICFERETIISEKNKNYHNKQTLINNAIRTLTVGKEYKIIDQKEHRVKVENDNGKKLWYTIDRFIFSLKTERKEKLKNLKCYE